MTKNTHAHKQQPHTHKTRGAHIPMNGGDEPSGSIYRGGTRKEGMWVLAGPWSTIFGTDDNNKKTANQKEAQQTSK